MKRTDWAERPERSNLALLRAMTWLSLRLGRPLGRVLLWLIAVFTNLFYYQRFSAAAVTPAGNHLGIFAALMPVLGGLIIGLMARYGSDRIRGHGIPEAMEAILI